MDRRTRARELALQALYQLDVQGASILGQMQEFFTENEPDKLSCKLAWEWTKGAWENLAVCDEWIVNSTKKWGLSRLSLVDKNILRLSVFHLKCCSDIPPKVVINEAIELAKKFSTEQSPAFVNGVLDSILKKITGENNSTPAVEEKT